MGTDVNTQEFSREDRRLFREQVGRCTEAVARMLANGLFTDQGNPPQPLLGMEVELNLVDRAMNPAMRPMMMTQISVNRKPMIRSP